MCVGVLPFMRVSFSTPAPHTVPPSASSRGVGPCPAALRRAPLDFESLKEKLEKLMTTDVDKKSCSSSAKETKGRLCLLLEFAVKIYFRAPNSICTRQASKIMFLYFINWEETKLQK
jgi:hypothetical protein